MVSENLLFCVRWGQFLSQLRKGTPLICICSLLGVYLVPGAEAVCDPKFQNVLPATTHSACLSPSANLVTSGVSPAEQTEIVNRHNFHRANVNPTASNMLKMSWDAEIAMIAQTYAENCDYSHDSSYQRIIPGRYGAGQNLAASSAADTWTGIVDLWHSEVSNFAFGSGSTNGNPIGHYTQVVWAESHKIGCGYAQCSNLPGFSSSGGHFYVCNYSPAGNVMPNLNNPYNLGSPCGDCPSTCDSTYSALCDCGTQHCFNFGTLNVNTCTCSCYQGLSFYVGSVCALNCTGIGTPTCPFSGSFTLPDSCPIYSNVPFYCPVTCGWCPDGDSTSYLTTAVDGNWGPWGGWTDVGSCSVTCGDGTLNQQRTRACDNPAPSNGGATCPGSATETQTVSCNLGTCPPVNGNWGPWGSWSDVGSCSVTCGDGTLNQQRTRACDNPAPSNGGATCPGSATETQTVSCNLGTCPPVNGNWGPWGSWSDVGSCSVTCGDGTLNQQRTRACDNPAPSNGGATCSGSATETQTVICNLGTCPPVNGNWGPWGSWTDVDSCSVACGDGTLNQQRTRACDSPAPSNGGKTCSGSATETQTVSCNLGTCPPVNGNWGPWGSWTDVGSCSVTCGDGTLNQQRTRACDNPAPSNGGATCSGSATESQTVSCNLGTCPPVNGNWGTWGSWTDVGSCSVTCGDGTLNQERTRACDNPAPSNGGATCSGSATETQTVSCNQEACLLVNGNWGPWGSWTDVDSCTVSCGSGVKNQQRTRACDNPAPSNGGAPCSGADTESQTVACNTGACPLPVSGPHIQGVVCGVAGSVTLTVTNAQGYFVYILGCSSTEGEYGGSGVSSANEEVTIDTCNIQLETSYTAALTTTIGVVTGDNVFGFTCVRNTGPATAITGLTAETGTATVSTTHFFQPTVMMKFTDGSSDKTGPAMSTSTVGELLHLHVWIADEYVLGGALGFDIRVKTVTVVSGGTSIILTGVDGPGTEDGCKAKYFWGEMADISQGYIRAEFGAFLIGSSTSLSQIYTAVVDVCAGSACVNYVCSTGGNPQAGRKRRDLSNETIAEEVQVTRELTILPAGVSDTEANTGDSELQSDQAKDCEVCMDKGAVSGVIAFAGITILLTNAASVFLYLKGRGFFKDRVEALTDTGH